MLNKTLKFDDDVLNVLRNMEWGDDGLRGVIPWQLERDLYERVNKALSAMGGKWNKKAKAHLFDSDPRSQVDGLIESGSLTVEKDGFFETPESIVHRMLELAPLPTYPVFVLEPSAGKGAIVRVLLELDKGLHAYALVEKNAQRARYLRETFKTGCFVYEMDFLDFKRGQYARVYMNPPFEEGQDIDHVRHAYDLLAPTGILVAVMGEGTFFRGDRRATMFREWLEAAGGESEKLPEGSFKSSGTNVNTRLVVIRKE